MEYSFPRYLLAKRTVDDRALNLAVYRSLQSNLPARPSLRITEAGAGTGTMLRRLLQWGLFERADYTVVDESAENIATAREWLPRWAQQGGLQVEESGEGLRLFDDRREVRAHPVASDIFEFIASKPPPADLLIAHAFLDLLPLPGSLGPLFSLIKPRGLAWLTLNFDGVTLFEPVIDPDLDAQILDLYHRTMDERLTRGIPSGDSRTGRHLFAYLRQAGAEILEAGASDWVVFPRLGQYPGDEAYFLHFVLHFFEDSLTGCPALDPQRFAGWLAARHAQVERGELVYIAHQVDFLVRPEQ